MRIVGSEQFVGGDQEYRSRGEREYARCRIAGVSLRGRRWEVKKENNLMLRGANDTPGSNTPFSAHEFSLIYMNRCLV